MFAAALPRRLSFTPPTISSAIAIPQSAKEQRDKDQRDQGISDVGDGQEPVEGTRFRAPDKPGIGVEINEEVVASRMFKYTEFPHLHRRDGSHANW